MSIAITGRVVDAECVKALIPEFPELKFSDAVIENGVNISYFDATNYIQSKKLDVSVVDFLKSTQRQLEILCSAYEINHNDVAVLDKKGHVLINGGLVLPFLTFVDNDFLVYAYDRMSEIMYYGFALSDGMAQTVLEQRGLIEINGKAENGDRMV